MLKTDWVKTLGFENVRINIPPDHIIYKSFMIVCRVNNIVIFMGMLFYFEVKRASISPSEFGQLCGMLLLVFLLFSLIIIIIH